MYGTDNSVKNPLNYKKLFYFTLEPRNESATRLTVCWHRLTISKREICMAKPILLQCSGSMAFGVDPDPRILLFSSLTFKTPTIN
jgi:hypothetical protein